MELLTHLITPSDPALLPLSPIMRFSFRGLDDVRQNRRFVAAAAIAFALAAIVFPIVLLAAFGHFSSTGHTPFNHAQRNTSQATGHDGDAITSSPSMAPITGTNSPTATTSSPSMAPTTGTNSPTEMPTETEMSPGLTLAPVVSFSPTLFPHIIEEAELQPTGLPSVSPGVISSSVPSMVPLQVLPDVPSLSPSMDPTEGPSRKPPPSPTTLPPFEPPSREPTPPPTILPSSEPSPPLTPLPSSEPPSREPTLPPTILPPSEPPILSTYRPGQLTVNSNGLLLSTGLSARIIATTGKFVQYRNGQTSSVRFHGRPDFGATFPDRNPFNPGGWIYTSNSEGKEVGSGGVGAITFDRNGNVLDYKVLLKGTTMNCGGGRTPWNTWISCEEFGARGQVYQVDPSGKRTAEKTVLGAQGGAFESFSYDVRNQSMPRFFVTEDADTGALRRFTPLQPNWDDPWTMLHGDGTLEYLVLEPTGNGKGNYDWVSDVGTAKSNAAKYYPNSEGIDVLGSHLYFVCKKIRQLFVLDLDNGTYTSSTTANGLFDGKPDQMSHIIGGDEEVLYFTEEGGNNPGVHGRSAQGFYYTILEGQQYKDETSGLAWDPSGHHLYVAYQETGLLFDVTRDDGEPFYGTSLNVKYHAQDQG